jgi:hypothetical protein
MAEEDTALNRQNHASASSFSLLLYCCFFFIITSSLFLLVLSHKYSFPYVRDDRQQQVWHNSRADVAFNRARAKPVQAITARADATSYTSILYM